MGLFKKSKEKQLRQDIRKGLRKNESVSIGTDGAVSGDGGNKVKLSGRGRRTAAREEAARRFSGDTQLPGGGNSKVTAKKNIKRKEVTPTSETTGIIERSKGKDRAHYSVTGQRGTDNRETKTSLTQGKRESAGSVEVQGIPSRLGNSFSFARGGKEDGLARTIKNANQGISDVRERSNQGLTNKSKSGFFMRSSPFNKPGDADEVFSVNRNSPQPGVNTSTTSASFDTPGRKVERQAETPEEINAWINAPQENKDKYKEAKSFADSSTSSTVSLDKVSPNVIKKEVTGSDNRENFSYGGGTSSLETYSNPDKQKIRKDKKDERQKNRIKRKADKKQGKLDKQGGGTNCRMVCD